MAILGFSTGAIARGDFRRALEVLRGTDLGAIELSALRERELEPLVAAFPSLPLSEFAYVSVHAPSRFDELTEARAVDYLATLPRHVNVVVHPDAMAEPASWERLGARLCIENMDQRKRTGRTIEELEPWFDRFPAAKFCLDVGHARQMDPTMSLATALLLRFQDRLAEVHMSEVDPFGTHRTMSYGARSAFSRIARRLPSHIPVILESIVSAPEIETELAAARRILDLRSEVAVSGAAAALAY